MLSFHLGLSSEQRAELEVELEKARQAGDLAWVNRVLSILLFAEGLVVREIAREEVAGAPAEVVQDQAPPVGRAH